MLFDTATIASRVSMQFDSENIAGPLSPKMQPLGIIRMERPPSVLRGQYNPGLKKYCEDAGRVRGRFAVPINEL